jgi:hypothetical protein
MPRISHGKGVYLYDESGKQYIDGSGGPVLFCIGHGNEEVTEAVKAQLDKVAFGYTKFFSSAAQEDLKALIGECAGGGLTRMVYVSSGSEAVESCLKVALQYHQANGEPSRTRFISRERSFHGNTLGALSVSGFLERRQPYEGALSQVSFLSPVNTYRPPAGVAPEDVAAHGAKELEDEIQRLGPGNVAAFIFEPVVGAAGGAVPAPPGYAKRVREICDRHGVLLISDEVLCGVGRCGTWRALEEDGVVPDLMSVAKGLAGGYVPLGAAVFQEYIERTILTRYEAIASGHTFTGHTAACAAGLAVQTIIKRDKLLAKVRADGAYMFDQLNEALGQMHLVGDIRGRGMLAGIEIVRDRETKESYEPEKRLHLRIKDRAFENGLIVYPLGGNVDGVRGDQVLIAPPYTATRAEIDEVVDKFAETLRQISDDL